MSKRRKQNPQPEQSGQKEPDRDRSGHPDIQNKPPMSWNSFESFWNSCVKGGTPSLMNACREHIKCLGWLGDQSKWIDGAIHFGLTIEK